VRIGDGSNEYEADMKSLIFTLTVAALLPAAAPAQKQEKRQPHPFAPSLPLLTEKEQAAIEEVIQRFIAADVGKLKGQAAAKAVADFNALGPEAIPALLDGLNESANLEHSCPVVLIAKKLAKMLSVSQDRKLLDFARDHIGTGVTVKRHSVTLKDLRLTCQLRMAELQRRELAAKKGGGVGAAGGGEKPAKSMPVAALAAAVAEARGPRLKEIITELGKRQGEPVVTGLDTAIRTPEEDLKRLAREQLVKFLTREPAAALEKRLKDERAEVRRAAAQAIGDKKLRLIGPLIGVLSDKDREVRQAARQSLVRLTGQDFGPEANASENDIDAAVDRWRDWWERQPRK
jgi:hypothetical protein